VEAEEKNKNGEKRRMKYVDQGINHRDVRHQSYSRPRSLHERHSALGKTNSQVELSTGAEVLSLTGIYELSSSSETRNLLTLQPHSVSH
jgi:hypothetical protein